MEGVTQFQYIGNTIRHTDNACPSVHCNVGKALAVCHMLGNLLWCEGIDNRVSALFYRVVIYAVLLFGSESWVLLDVMMRAVEGIHVGFPRHITGERSKQKDNTAWETPES